MVYQPGIPTGLVDLDQDYLAIQQNFTGLDTTFGIDHVTFSNTTLQNGYHKDIHFNPVSTTVTNAPNNYVTATQYPQGVPVTVAGIGQLFSSEVNDAASVDTGLYWKTGNGLQVAMTRNFSPVRAASGYTFLPGGLIMQWGTQLTTTSGAGTTFNWPRPFTTFYSGQLTVRATSTADVRVASFLNTPTATQATIFVKNENGALRAENVFFTAIGI
jgi:hypothetical protein